MLGSPAAVTYQNGVQRSQDESWHKNDAMTSHVWLDVIISVSAALLLSWLALIVALAI
jgi:hypothetical protein